MIQKKFAMYYRRNYSMHSVASTYKKSTDNFVGKMKKDGYHNSTIIF